MNASVFRQIVSFWRNKKSFIFELLACSITFFVYIVFFESLLVTNKDNFRMNLLLTNTKIFYFIDPKLKQNNFDVQKYFKTDESHIWGDQYYNPEKQINLVNGETELSLTAPVDFRSIKEFDEFIFDKFPYHNEKAAIYLKESLTENFKYEVYSLFNLASVNYSFAMKNFILSTFLKNEYNINTDLIVILIFFDKL